MDDQTPLIYYHGFFKKNYRHFQVNKNYLYYFSLFIKLQKVGRATRINVWESSIYIYIYLTYQQNVLHIYLARMFPISNKWITYARFSICVLHIAIINLLRSSIHERIFPSHVKVECERNAVRRLVCRECMHAVNFKLWFQNRIQIKSDVSRSDKLE